MPMRGELPIRVVAQPYRRATVMDNVLSGITAVITNTELTVLAVLCATGLLLSVWLIQYFPDYGEIAATLASP
jgi:hypothetical protein